MSDTPETDKQAVGAIGFYSCATVPADLARRLERERDEARIRYRSTHALAEALVKTQVELKAERDEALTVMRETRRRLDDAWLEIEQLKKDRELLKRQRDDGWQEIKRLTKGMEKWT